MGALRGIDLAHCVILTRAMLHSRWRRRRRRRRHNVGSCVVIARVAEWGEYLDFPEGPRSGRRGAPAMGDVT